MKYSIHVDLDTAHLSPDEIEHLKRGLHKAQADGTLHRELKHLAHEYMKADGFPADKLPDGSVTAEVHEV